MRYVVSAILVAFTIMIAPINRAKADVEIIEGCIEVVTNQGNNLVGRGICIGVVQASLYYSARIGACVPREVTVGQVIRVFNQYAATRMNRWHEPLPHLMAEAMKAAWPCR